MPLQDDLYASAMRWAEAALDAFTANPPDHDFAVHHMAVAVEHLSKAYLCSISEVLLVGERPNVDDLLVLSGRSDRTRKQHADVKTIGGAEAIARAEFLLGRKVPNAEQVRRLREARNGVTHLGQSDGPRQPRTLLAAGIEYLNDLLGELGVATASFWGVRDQFVRDLAAQALSELELRYHEKIRRARQVFQQRFGSIRNEEARAAQIAAISVVPLLTRWMMVSPTPCPACGSPAAASGRDYSEDFGTWFSPRFFGCRVCELRLEDAELELAGIGNQFLDEGEVDPNWEPDPEYMRRLAERVDDER